jgi:polyisoprenoid-binding protein YceI
VRAYVLSAALVLVCPGLAGAQAAADAESWNVAGGEVRVRCRMTVGGSFDAVTSDVSGTLQRGPSDLGSYTGALRVALATLDTGIGLRNEHLRSTYLELDRGPEFHHAVLSGIVLDEPPPAGNGGHETGFSGTLTLHGVQRAVEGEAELRRRGGRMQVEAQFSLSLDAFDIPPPRYLGIGVRDTIEVTVRFEATDGEISSDGRS